jgi:hypothetical protein
LTHLQICTNAEVNGSRGTYSVSDISPLGQFSVGANTPNNTFKPKCTQIEFIDENVDHPHWIFFDNVIVHVLRQQGELRQSLTSNEMLLIVPP